MKPEEALGLCQAYWDDELDAETVEKVEACLAQDAELAALFEQENEFHGFIRDRSARVNAPANLADGIKARLAKEQAAEIAPIAHVTAVPLKTSSTFSRRSWMAAAASVVLVAGVATYLLKPAHECPYMVACADATAQVVDGKNALQMQSSDRAKIAAFVADKVKLPMKEVPALTAFQMNPMGAGTTSFDALKPFGSPDAAFVEYKTPAGEKATLFIHPWFKGEPEAFNKTEYDGKSYWAANHDHMAMAVWKCEDSKMLMSLVSTRSKSETLHMADEIRKAISQINAAQVNSLTNSGSQVAHASN